MPNGHSTRKMSTPASTHARAHAKSYTPELMLKPKRQRYADNSGPQNANDPDNIGSGFKNPNQKL